MATIARYPISIALNQEQYELLEQIKAHKVTIKEVFVSGLQLIAEEKGLKYTSSIINGGLKKD